MPGGVWDATKSVGSNKSRLVEMRRSVLGKPNKQVFLDLHMSPLAMIRYAALRVLCVSYVDECIPAWPSACRLHLDIYGLQVLLSPTRAQAWPRR